MEQFFQFQYLATFEDGFVLVVNDGIAVGLIFGAMKHKINAKLLDDATITLDAEPVLSFIALIAHRFQNGLELFDGREMVLHSLFDGIGCPLLLTLSHNAADDFLRTNSFMMVVDFVAIGGNSAGDDVQVVVVSIVMGIDENGLTILTISHLFEILMGNV